MPLKTLLSHSANGSSTSRPFNKLTKLSTFGNAQVSASKARRKRSPPCASSSQYRRLSMSLDVGLPIDCTCFVCCNAVSFMIVSHTHQRLSQICCLYNTLEAFHRSFPK